MGLIAALFVSEEGRELACQEGGIIVIRKMLRIDSAGLLRELCEPVDEVEPGTFHREPVASITGPMVREAADALASLARYGCQANLSGRSEAVELLLVLLERRLTISET